MIEACWRTSYGIVSASPSVGFCSVPRCSSANDFSFEEDCFSFEEEALFRYPPKIVHTALIPIRKRQGVLPNSAKKWSLFREALPVVAVAFYVCFGLAIKFPGADGHLAHARAPDSRTDASRFFLCFASLPFCFGKGTAKPGGTLASLRPSFGSSVWQVPLGARGTPCAPGGHAGRDASRPAARPWSSGRHEREEKGRTGRPASPARLERRAPGTSSGVKRHVFRRATGASCGAQPARFPARNRRVLRRATGASRGAHPARLATCNRHVPAACILRRPAHPDARKSARYRASILNPSLLGSAAGKV